MDAEYRVLTRVRDLTTKKCYYRKPRDCIEYDNRTTGYYPAMCSIGNKFGVLSGGAAPCDNTDGSGQVNKVQRIDIELNIVEDLPDLNLARQKHASCSLGDAVYVFCGQADIQMDWLINTGPVNSIEQLKGADRPSDELLGRLVKWTVIDLGEKFLPRIHPAVSRISANRIVIFGGETAPELHYELLLGDVWIFNGRTSKGREQHQGDGASALKCIA